MDGAHIKKYCTPVVYNIIQNNTLLYHVAFAIQYFEIFMTVLCSGFKML